VERPVGEGGEQEQADESADRVRIREGLDAAERGGRPIDHPTARRIAAQLHGGQNSPLYSLASSGTLREPADDDDIGLGVRTLANELAECRRFFGQDVEPWIAAIEAYAAGREDKGPVTDWVELTADQPDTPTAERSRIVTPRVYVASLADYNNGTLHGRWIDADQDPEELAAEVQSMLRQSREPVAEDWAIHDYEGFGAFQVAEYESLEVISAVALGIAECGPAFAAYASWAGTSEEALRRFGDCFLGYWPSLAEYARDFGADLGWEAELEKLPEGMRPYVEVDYQQLARDLDSELTTVESGGGVYVFREP
jgi:antirestriction protein